MRPVTTYHPGLTSLMKIINKHLPILHASKELKQAIPNSPLVTYRPKNLRDLLVRSALTTPAPSTNTGNNKCNNKRCKCCQEMVTSNTFKSQITGRKHHIRSNISCKTKKNLVYLISRKKYSQLYVGETENALQVRMNRHHSNIRTRKKKETSCSPLLPIGPDDGGPTCEGEREAAHTGEEGVRASVSSPSECCLHMG